VSRRRTVRIGVSAPYKVSGAGRETAQNGEGEPGQHGRRMLPTRWSERESEFRHPSRSSGAEDISNGP
jgi:hypothetical protein